jgi:glycerate-2-kinase
MSAPPPEFPKGLLGGAVAATHGGAIGLIPRAPMWIPRPSPAPRGLGLDPAAFLANNDLGAFFAGLGDRVVPGPTITNGMIFAPSASIRCD